MTQYGGSQAHAGAPSGVVRALVMARPAAGRLFVIGLWFVTCFYLLGRWGMNSDDYCAGVMDPVSGELDWSIRPWRVFPYFWRPLLILEWHFLHSLLWHHMWALHLLGAACHGGVAWMIARVGTRVVGRGSATIAALVFLVFPLNFQVVYWATAMSISQAALLWLVLVLVALRHAERGGWWRVVLGAVIAFAIPCLYEQPMAGYPMLVPLALVALARRVEWKMVLGRAVAMTGACGVAGMAYMALLVATVPADRRGSGQSLVALEADGLVSRVQEVAAQVGAYPAAWLPDSVRGGLILGWHKLDIATGFWTLGALAAAGLLWAMAPRSEGVSVGETEIGGERGGSAGIRAWRAAGLLGCGLGTALLSFAPIVVIEGQPVPPRTIYFTLVGCALALAGMLDLVFVAGERAGRRGTFERAARLVALPLLLAGAVIGVGWQMNFRARHRADVGQAASLAHALPNPPGWLTIMIPFEDRHRPVNTGAALFDTAVPKWTLQGWSANALMPQTYRRRDLWMLPHNPWAPLILRDADEKGFRLRDRLPYRAKDDPRGGSWLTWKSCIPFIIDEHGAVRAVNRIVVQSADGADVVADLPHVTSLANGSNLDTYTQPAHLTSSKP